MMMKSKKKNGFASFAWNKSFQRSSALRMTSLLLHLWYIEHEVFQINYFQASDDVGQVRTSLQPFPFDGNLYSMVCVYYYTIPYYSDETLINELQSQSSLRFWRTGADIHCVLPEEDDEFNVLFRVVPCIALIYYCVFFILG